MLSWPLLLLSLSFMVLQVFLLLHAVGLRICHNISGHGHNHPTPEAESHSIWIGHHPGDFGWTQPRIRHLEGHANYRWRLRPHIRTYPVGLRLILVLSKAKTCLAASATQRRQQDSSRSRVYRDPYRLHHACRPEPQEWLAIHRHFVAETCCNGHCDESLIRHHRSPRDSHLVNCWRIRSLLLDPIHCCKS